MAHRAEEKSKSSTRCATELEKRPGVLYNFSQPIKDRVEESISGIRGQVVVKIYGEDLAIMQDKLEQVTHVMRRRAARATSRCIAPESASTSSPTSIATRPRATAFHVSDVEDVVRERLRRDARDVDVGGGTQGRRSREAPVARRRGCTPSVALEVPAGDARVPLSSLAKVHVDMGRTQINREQGGRFFALKMQHRGARHGLVRRRSAGARRQRSEASRRLLS